MHLIELKFRRYSLKSRSMDGLQKLWDEGYQQIKATRVPAGHYGRHRKLFKSTLLIVPIYKDGKVEHELDAEGRKNLLDLSRAVVSRLKPQPDWSGLWALCDKHAGPVEIRFGHYFLGSLC